MGLFHKPLVLLLTNVARDLGRTGGVKVFGVLSYKSPLLGRDYISHLSTVWSALALAHALAPPPALSNPKS